SGPVRRRRSYALTGGVSPKQSAAIRAGRRRDAEEPGLRVPRRRASNQPSSSRQTSVSRGHRLRDGRHRLERQDQPTLGSNLSTLLCLMSREFVAVPGHAFQASVAASASSPTRPSSHRRTAGDPQGGLIGKHQLRRGRIPGGERLPTSAGRSPRGGCHRGDLKKREAPQAPCRQTRPGRGLRSVRQPWRQTRPDQRRQLNPRGECRGGTEAKVSPGYRDLTYLSRWLSSFSSARASSAPPVHCVRGFVWYVLRCVVDKCLSWSTSA